MFLAQTQLSVYLIARDQIMATALRVELTPATAIQTVKKMKRKEGLIFLEDLMAATSPAYLRIHLGEPISM